MSREWGTDAHVHHRTERAVLVSASGDPDDAVWLPLSQVEIEETDDEDVVHVTMPEWLARKAGLVD